MALQAAFPLVASGELLHALNVAALMAAVTVALGALLVAPRTAAYRRVRDENADLGERCATLEHDMGGCKAENARLQGQLEGLEKYAAPSAFQALERALVENSHRESAERQAVMAHLRELTDRQRETAEAVKYLANELRDHRGEPGELS